MDDIKVDLIQRKLFLGLRLGGEKHLQVIEKINLNTPFMVGDLIIDIDGHTLKDASDLNSLLDCYNPHKEYLVNVLRDNDSIAINTKLLEIPKETAEEFSIEYSCFLYKNQKIRLIITKPKTDMVATVFFIQGIGCNSIDYPLTDHPYKKLLYEFTKNGFTTIRVELFGTGDSEGGESKNASFLDILDLYNEALVYITKKYFINKLILFGYSVGGIMAPFLGSKNAEHVSKIVVFGTILGKLSSYIPRNVKRQMQLRNCTTGEILEKVKAYQKIVELLLINKQTPHEIIAADNNLSQYFEEDKYFIGHAYLYSQQIEEIDIWQIWRDSSIPTIIVAGEKDVAIDYNYHVNLLHLLRNKNVDAKLLSLPINHDFMEKDQYGNEHFSVQSVLEICSLLYER